MSRASDRRAGRSWPGFLFGGRVRTSTVVLLIAFCATWWLFETYQPAPAPPEQVPASEVVPPGFIPDPAYTWAPRTAVQTRPTTTTPTPTTSPTTTETEATTTEGEPSTSAEATPGAPPTSGPSTPVPSSTVESHSSETPLTTPPAPATATSPTPAPPAR